MSRVIVLIDGEHYPPVVRFALEQLADDHDVMAAAFLGGTEKVDFEAGLETYGIPLVWADSAHDALVAAIEAHNPDLVIDLSDEPVVTSAERFELAGVALSHGVQYRGADFHFYPPMPLERTMTPALSVIGTGKRVGKTAVSAYTARLLKSHDHDIVVLAMGRGGPAEPELIRGDEVALTTPDLLALARQGKHAASDNYEDAVMSRVTTVGCRRCGGGMAGETYFSNVPEGARLADSLGKELLVLEGSGAAIPPVHADATVLIVGAGRGLTYVRDYFGPFRVRAADAVVLATAEEPNTTPEEVAALVRAVREIEPKMPVIATTFRPAPLEPVEGARVFFATTAPQAVLPKLREYLESEFGCSVVGASHNLSNRSLLRRDMQSCAGAYDLLLTELKAAAIDVVATAGEEAGVRTVLCDNVPVPVDGGDLDGLLLDAANLALERGKERRRDDGA